MLRWSGLVVVVLASVWCGSARAGELESARDHYIQGSKAFDLGLYARAIEEYMAAYDAKPDPALLYDIAQAHKLAGHAAEALRFYRVYLVRVPDAANADEVRAKIAELQRAIEQQQKAQMMPPDHVKPPGSVETRAAATASPSPAPAPMPAAATPEPMPAAATPEPATPSLHAMRAARPGRARTIAGGVTAAIGVAVLVTGIALAAVAHQDAEQLTAADRQQGVFDAGKDASGRALGTAGPALIGVGAAVTVAGGVVAVLGVRASRRGH